MTAAADLPKPLPFLGIFYQPCVAGMRTDGWHGPVLAEVDIAEGPLASVGKRFMAGADELVAKLEARCTALGGNAMVGAEFFLDPWVEGVGMRMWACGTCARLSPMWDTPGASAPLPEFTEVAP